MNKLHFHVSLPFWHFAVTGKLTVQRDKGEGGDIPQWILALCEPGRSHGNIV